MHKAPPGLQLSLPISLSLINSAAFGFAYFCSVSLILLFPLCFSLLSDSQPPLFCLVSLFDSCFLSCFPASFLSSVPLAADSPVFCCSVVTSPLSAHHTASQSMATAVAQSLWKVTLRTPSCLCPSCVLSPAVIEGFQILYRAFNFGSQNWLFKWGL